MIARSQFIKVRVNRDEYRDIQQRADGLGQTLSEYVRDTVTAVHATVDVVAALDSLRRQCLALATPTAGSSNGKVVPEHDALTSESVLILRELAAARDAQILTRVRAKLQQIAASTAPTGRAA